MCVVSSTSPCRDPLGDLPQMMLRHAVLVDESLGRVEGRLEVVVSDVEALHSSLHVHLDREYVVILHPVDGAAVAVSCERVNHESSREGKGSVGGGVAGGAVRGRNCIATG